MVLKVPVWLPCYCLINKINKEKSIVINKKVRYCLIAVIILLLTLTTSQVVYAATKKADFKPVIEEELPYRPYSIQVYNPESDYRVYKISGYNEITKKSQEYIYYYTLDGSTPTRNSQRYYHSITLRTGKKYTLKVTAYDGSNKGQTVTKQINLKNEKMTKQGKIFWKLYDKYVTPDMTDFERLVVVAYWMDENMTYVFDDYNNNPIVTGTGVCSGFSKAFQYLAQGMGVETGCVVGKMYTNDRADHEWNYVRVEGYYYELEPQDRLIDLSTSKYVDTFRTYRPTGKKKDKSINELYTDFRITPLMEKVDYQYIVAKFTKVNKLTYQEGCKIAGFDDDYIIDNKDNIGKNLTEVVLPESVTEVRTFFKAKKLTTINLEKVEKFQGGAFYECSRLESVDISSLKESKDYLFANCTSLKNVKLPFVESIGEGTFYGCSDLTTIKLPDTLKIIDNNMFDGCTSLQTVILPESLETIGVNAFYDCKSLKQIDLPNHLKVIEEYAFQNTKIQNVTIPGSVEEIRMEVFTPSLKSVYFEENNERECLLLNGSFYNTSLEKIDYPKNTLFDMKGNAEFDGNTTLKSVTFSEGTTDIPCEMFKDCVNLTTVKLPESIQYIWEYAFYNCSSLNDIYVPEGLIEVGVDAFEGTGIPNIDAVLPEHVFYRQRMQFWTDED